MTDFAAFHVGTAAAGGAAWIDGHPYTGADRPRGCVGVEDDGNVRFYRVPRSARAAFRRWAAAVFSGMNCRHLRGAWPSYRVES